jgi:hypothetical protein
MSRARAAIAVVLVAASVVLALLASDVLRWRSAVRSGDVHFGRSPATATWTARTLVPSDPARALLGLDVPLRFRAAEQSFDAVRAAGRGVDNGLSEARARGELETRLAELALSPDHSIASAADNLLGILAFEDAGRAGPMTPAPVDQSVADFQAAIRLDPKSAEAKFNLELLLRQLLARGVRKGPGDNGAAPTHGHRGGGGGLPGRGY